MLRTIRHYSNLSKFTSCVACLYKLCQPFDKIGISVFEAFLLLNLLWLGLTWLVLRTDGGFNQNTEVILSRPISITRWYYLHLTIDKGEIGHRITSLQTFSKWIGFYHYRIWYSFANLNSILAMRYITFLYRNTSLEKYCFISIYKSQAQEFQDSNFKIQENQVQQYVFLSSFWQWYH